MADTDKKEEPKQDTTKEQPKDKEPTAAELALQLKKAQDVIAELNEENKKRRLSEKETKEKADRFEKAFKIATGKDETPDPVAMEKAKVTSKLKSLHLKAAFVNIAAKEMHDADFAFGALASRFKDVSVDDETGEVDKAELTKCYEEVKKSHAFLFVPAQGGGNNQPPPKPNQGGQPAGGNGTAFQQWQALKKDPSRIQESHEFYAKNKPAIQASWPKGQ